jgi:hypothetical protein
MLDERQARIWDSLTAINRYENGIVDRIVSRYVEEAGKVIMDNVVQTAAESALTE